MEWNIKWGEENDCVFFTGSCLVRLAAEISDWWSEICQEVHDRSIQTWHRDCTQRHLQRNSSLRNENSVIIYFIIFCSSFICCCFSVEHKWRILKNLHIDLYHPMTVTMDQWPIWELSVTTEFFLFLFFLSFLSLPSNVVLYGKDLSEKNNTFLFSMDKKHHHTGLEQDENK